MPDKKKQETEDIKAKVYDATYPKALYLSVSIIKNKHIYKFKKGDIMKKQTLQLIGMVVIVIFSITITNAQITSYSDGGVWISDTTWIGGVVPGAGDNVVINGTVYVMGNDACLNITINSGDTLRNQSVYNRALDIYGNITNNGVIKNNTSGNLSLNISGDITNNGTWDNTSTHLDGTTAQNIYLEPGKTFDSDFTITNSSDTIHALTDLIIDGYFNIGGNVLNLNNHIVEFIGTDHYFGSGTIISPSEFRGEVNMNGTTTIEGDLIITDTLQNRNAHTATVWLNGNLTNNGIVKNKINITLFFIHPPE